MLGEEFMEIVFILAIVFLAISAIIDITTLFKTMGDSAKKVFELISIVLTLVSFAMFIVFIMLCFIGA